VTCKLRVSLRDGESMFVNVICFAKPAMTALLALSDRDSVAIAGELTPTVWTDKEGTARAGLDLVAHAVLSEYHVARKRRAARGESPSDGEATPAVAATREGGFDDSIPF
jgi:single-stranded DNA-binding protein